MNFSMFGSTIQGLEVQRATIATLRAFAGNASAFGTGAPSPLDVALGLKPAPSGEEPAAASYIADAGAASQAWWNMLQQQFNNLAAATAASMPTPQAPKAAASKSPRNDDGT